MSNQFVELGAASGMETTPILPRNLPHGLIAPPQRVKEHLGQEKARFGPAIFTPEAEERSLNNLVLQHYFDGLAYEVLYRSTPDGPEVLAVGYEEIQALTKDMPLAERQTLKSWVP